MAWINAWQRAEAIEATNKIIGDDAPIEEYNRVLGILEKAFGTESDAVRAREEYLSLPEPERKAPCDRCGVMIDKESANYFASEWCDCKRPGRCPHGICDDCLHDRVLLED